MESLGRVLVASVSVARQKTLARAVRDFVEARLVSGGKRAALPLRKARPGGCRLKPRLPTKPSLPGSMKLFLFG